MATFILVLLFSFAVAMALPDFQYDLEKADEYFQAFIEEYGKNYTNEDVKAQKFEVFKESLKTYNAQNLEQVNAKFGVNEDSDLTIEEFTQSRLGYIHDSDSQKICKLSPVPRVNPPREYDWQKQGYVTPVKKQNCKDCWAFSATGNIESQYAKLHKKLVNFSEQQLVDCDTTSHGCKGGRATRAFMYLMNVTGQMSRVDYPYKGKEGKCAFDTHKAKVKVTGCKLYKIDRTREEDLVKVLYKHGPVSVSVDATSWKGLLGGIINKCINHASNHAVLLVGYGVENNVSFWRIKNSWGSKRAEEGYYRLERGKNLCGILDYSISTITVK